MHAESHDPYQLHAAYVSRVNMAVAADRDDIAHELADDYEAVTRNTIASRHGNAAGHVIPQPQRRAPRRR